MSQQIAWQLSLLLMTLVAFGFAFAAFHSGVREPDYGPLQAQAYRLRTKLFALLLVTLGPAMIYNLMDVPYSATHSPGSAIGVQVIKATGYQWRWELSNDRVAVGKPVEFHVSSADINHGFGIYDTEMRLVAQTQAMPGYTNKLRHTFKEKGTYKILCLEYCGIAHHNMMTEIKVVDL